MSITLASFNFTGTRLDAVSLGNLYYMNHNREIHPSNHLLHLLNSSSPPPNVSTGKGQMTMRMNRQRQAIRCKFCFPHSKSNSPSFTQTAVTK